MHLDPRSTALVLIDLQKGSIGTPLAARSGRDVLATATAFANGSAPQRACCAALPLHLG